MTLGLQVRTKRREPLLEGLSSLGKVGTGGSPPQEKLICIAISSNDGIGSANSPRLFISAEREGLATAKELCIEEPFSHTMLSKRRSSNEFRCLLNSLGRDSSCLMKLSITLLRSKAVIPVLSSTAGNNIVTVL